MDLPASLQLALNLIRAGEGLLLVSGLVLDDQDKRTGAQRMAADYHAAAEEITAHLAKLATPAVHATREKPVSFTSAGTTRFYFTRNGEKPVEYDGKTHYASFEPGSRLWEVRILNAGGEIQNALHESWELHCEYPFGKTSFDAPPPQPPAATDEKRNEEKRRIPEGWYLDGCVEFHFEHDGSGVCGPVFACDKYTVEKRPSTWAVVERKTHMFDGGADKSHLLVCTTPTGAQRVYTFESMNPTIRPAPPAAAEEKKKQGEETKPMLPPGFVAYTVKGQTFRFQSHDGREIGSNPVVYTDGKYIAGSLDGAWVVVDTATGMCIRMVAPEYNLATRATDGDWWFVETFDNRTGPVPQKYEKKKEEEQAPKDKPLDLKPINVVIGPVPPEKLPTSCKFFFLRHRRSGISIEHLPRDKYRVVREGDNCVVLDISDYEKRVVFPMNGYELFYYNK